MRVRIGLGIGIETKLFYVIKFMIICSLKIN